MGQLVSQSLPNLVGGVSQQSSMMRRSNQCEEQRNCWNSIVDGLGIRPATKRKGTISSIGENSFILDYKRDHREFYKVCGGRPGSDPGFDDDIPF